MPIIDGKPGRLGMKERRPNMAIKILFGLSIALNIVLMLLVGFYAGRDSERARQKKRIE
jgi:hypothetical protein